MNEITSQAIIVALIGAYVACIAYLLVTDNGDGKRRTVAGWMLFGVALPVVRNIKNNGLTRREKIGLVGLILLTLSLVVLSAQGVM